jgi:hypothetical protein
VVEFLVDGQGRASAKTSVGTAFGDGQIPGGHEREMDESNVKSGW